MKDISSQNGQQSTWGTAAEALLLVEHEQTWRKMGFSSYSAYIVHEAKQRQITKSSLWRLRSAGRYYGELRAKLGSGVPGLTEPGIAAAPESLELLKKISRVAPAELLQDLEIRTMLGEISRRELRDIWESYRPVLGGETKRGRGMQEPRYDPQNAFMRAALTEANALAAIVKSAPTWLGYSDLSLYRAVHISGSRSLNSLYPALPDLVLLITQEENSPLDIHGIEAGINPSENKYLQKYSVERVNTDYVWFATVLNLVESELLIIPEEIGVFFVSEKGIALVRQAKRLYPKNNEYFLREILKEVARTRRTVVEE